MPNSDTWPRAVAMEPLSNMDSAGSYDSVISVNSACSEDSMEHLSAEERACLMYLEETIESLDVQDDSGFSNDEPDSAILRLTHGGSENLPNSRPFSNMLTVVEAGESPACTTDPSDEFEHKTENPTVDSGLVSSPITNTGEVHSNIPAAETASGRATPVTAPHSLSTERNPPSVLTGSEPSSKASSEMDMSLIPPPSDFMDEPLVPLDSKKPPTKVTPRQKPTIDLEQLRLRASGKTPQLSAQICSAPQDKLSSELCASQTLSPPSPQTGSPVATGPKSPPVVAPKPKKLPANIILKPHKSAGSYESSMGHPVTSTADRLQIDPQRVRMEALRKLGLLKSEEVDSGPALNMKSSPQNRRSWAPTSSPLSSPPPKSAPPVMPNTYSVNSNSPLHTPVPSSHQTVVGQCFSPTPPSTLHVQSEVLPDIIPVPAAFSDPVHYPHDNVFVGITESVVGDQGHLEPGSPLLQDQKLTPPMVGGVKSATLERSGLGLGSYMESLEQQTLGQLRNSRPRPASLGSGKDFSSAHGEVAHTSSKNPDSHACVPAPAPHSDTPQKLPRSQGISVLICPRAQSEEARREALKKLGLLRD